MASFADSISQFNPYIQQLPVEAMTQVGMYKQQKYDEGIQKVQSYIDNVAGLEVVKPLQKAYLQSKLNELGSKLKTVAAGDFSNYQLVNSVGGMATQIAKDPTIQSAVLSTQKIKRGEQDLDAARKAGKNSVQNEAWWNKTTNDWMSDGSLDSSFNGRYVEYRDMEEKLRGVAKDVHEYDSSIEVPYIRDNQGKTLYFYTDKATKKEIATTDPTKGAPKVDQAILKTKVKGKSAEKILENFYMSLDENDKQQLGIDGWYHYRGYTGEGFKNKVKQDVSETLTTKKKIREDALARITVELAANTMTADQKREAESRLNNLTDYLNKGGFQKDLESQLEKIDSMDELSLKQSVYTENFLTGLADNIAYQDIQTEYKDNPYWKALMDTKKLEFDYWNAQRQQANDNRKYALDLAAANLAERKFNFDVSKELLTREGTPKIWEELGTQTEGKEIPTLNMINAGIAKTESDMTDFVVANQDVLLPNSKNQTPQQKRAAMNKLFSEYIANPKIYEGDNNKIRLMERYRSMQIDLTRQISTHKTIQDESNERYGKKLDAEIGKAGGIVFTGGGGYSAKELISEFTNIKGFTTTGTRVLPNGAVAVSTVMDESAILRNYQGTKYEPIAKAYIKKQKGQPLTNVEKVILEKANYLDDTFGKKVKTLVEDKRNFEAQKVGRLLPQYQMKVTSYNYTNDKDKVSVDRMVDGMYGVFNNLGSLDTEKFDPNTISKWRKDKEDLKYALVKSDDGSSAKFIIQKGTEVQEIPLNQKQLQQYFPEAAKTNMLDNAKYMIINSPNRTTNAINSLSGGADAAINAAFSGEALPLIQGTGLSGKVRFDLEGAKDNDGGDNDVYQIRMYVFDDNGNWKSDIVNKNGYATFAGVAEILRNIGVTKYEEVKNKK